MAVVSDVYDSSSGADAEVSNVVDVGCIYVVGDNGGTVCSVIAVR